MLAACAREPASPAPTTPPPLPAGPIVPPFPAPGAPTATAMPTATQTCTPSVPADARAAGGPWVRVHAPDYTGDAGPVDGPRWWFEAPQLPALSRDGKRVLLFAVELAFSSTPSVAVTSRSIAAVTVSVATVRPIEAPTATLLPSVWPVRNLRADVEPANFTARLGLYSMDNGSPLSAGTWAAAKAGADAAARGRDETGDGVHRLRTGLLRKLYLETIQALTLEGREGTRVTIAEFSATVDKVEANTKGEGFVADCNWMARGIVGHWGHSHPRVNIYNARVTITPAKGEWKLTGLEVQEVRRK